MITRKSLYINVQAGGKSEIERGIAWLLDLANKDASKRSALLVVPILQTLEYDIASIIGDGAVKRLAKGEAVKINSSLSLSLMTERKTVYSWSGPVLAAYPPRKLLDLIDGLTGVTDVLVIPWGLKEIQYWIDTWSATPLGAAAPVALQKSTMNPVVESALETLTHRVNLSTGISHPSDRTAAVRMFEILRDNGFRYDPKETRAWLVAKGGWNPGHANEVESIAVGILAGKRYKVERSGWSEKILDIWKEEAKKKQAKK